MRRLLVLTTLIGCTLPLASARAADPIVVNQSAREISAFGGNLVYERKPAGKWECRRFVGGKVLTAHGVPAPGCEGRMTIDSKGRVVLPFFIERVKHSRLISVRWYLYDVKSDSVRRLTGLPAGRCPLDPVVIWGHRMVYGVSCSSKKRNGLWFKDGKTTRRILDSTVTVAGLALRGGTLAGIINAFAEDTQIYQLAVDGKPCVRAIEGSQSSAANDDLGGLWIANGNIVWSTGYFRGGPADSSTGEFLTSKVPSHCTTPGPNGRYEFTPESKDLRSFELDGRQLYYAGYDGIRRHTFPAQPSYPPPANDNFENAQSLVIGTPGNGRTAWATTQPGEPLADAKQTIWYTFTPPTSGTLYVSLSGGFRNMNDLRFGVYSGTSLATLTPVAGPASWPSLLQFDAVAGRQYWIDLGSTHAAANFQPLSVRVGTTQY